MGALTNKLSEVDFVGFITALYSGGWYDFVFPFMLVYAIVFTILQKVKIIDKKSVKVVIALVFALFAVAFPINGNLDCGVNSTSGGGYNADCPTMGSLLMSLFPGVTAFAFGVLALYIVIAMLGVDLTEFLGGDFNNYVKYIIGGIGAFVVIYYYAVAFGWNGFDSGGTFDWLWGDNGLIWDPMLYILAIGGWIFYMISSGDNDEPDDDDETETTTTTTNKRKKS